MSEYLSAHLKNACSIIQRYTYKEPFPKFIKEYFRKNKKFGSRDRKIISEFCYCYFRVGESCEGGDIAFQ
ncbi:MAG: Fmu (Sun) domain-containing protein, partial [Chitinophagaceae bacterium]